MEQLESRWTPVGLQKITWTPAESTWNMWGKVKSSIATLVLLSLVAVALVMGGC